MIVFHASKTAENYEADAYVALTYGFLAAHALGLGGSAMDMYSYGDTAQPELRKMVFDSRWQSGGCFNDFSVS